MNTTTITINWNDYEGYRAALNEVSMSTTNTFEKQSDNFSLTVNSGMIRYTPEKLIEALDYFQCRKKRPVRELSYKRFMIWRYVYYNFNVTTEDIGRVSNHSHASVIHGMRTINNIMKVDKSMQEMYDEVFEYCEKLFNYG